MVLTEAGVDRVTFLTRKPQGVAIRDYFQRVAARLRRGEAVRATEPAAVKAGARRPVSAGAGARTAAGAILSAFSVSRSSSSSVRGRWSRDPHERAGPRSRDHHQGPENNGPTPGPESFTGARALPGARPSEQLPARPARRPRSATTRSRAGFGGASRSTWSRRWPGTRTSRPPSTTSTSSRRTWRMPPAVSTKRAHAVRETLRAVRRAAGERPAIGRRSAGDRPENGRRTAGERPENGRRTAGERPANGRRSAGER